MPAKPSSDTASSNLKRLDEGRKLRPEAHSASWKELDESQQHAFRKIASLIGEAVDDLSDPEKKRPSSDDEGARPSRTSRTAFLSGERGTGKTTVFQSLRRYTSSSAEDLPEAGVDLLKLRRRVIWLPELDMEPVQQDINLLIALMARIEESLGLLVRATDGEEEDRVLDPVAGPALLDFQRLQTNIVLGWSSNVEQRRGQLDPDSFALELMRSERARLALARDLGRVLDQLVADLPRAMKKESPIFVLPLDDLDLNARSCLQLLRLMRMISTPRLFLLILGDERLAELVINLQMSSDLSKLVSDVRDTSQLSVPAYEIGGWAGSIAANAMRKLLPPAQRVYLDRISLWKAMDFRPLGASDSDPWLHHLLALCPVAPKNDGLYFPKWSVPGSEAPQGSELEQIWPDAGSSLRDLFLACVPQVDSTESETKFPLTRRLEEKKKKEKKEIKTDFQAKAFLKVPLRTLTDFWFSMQEIGGLEDPGRDKAKTLALRADKLLQYVAKRCLRSLSGAHSLYPEDRQKIPYAIRKDGDDQWELWPLPLVVRSDGEVVRVLRDLKTIEALPPDPGGPPSMERPKTKRSKSQNLTAPTETAEQPEMVNYTLQLTLRTGSGWRFGAPRPRSAPPPGVPGSSEMSGEDSFLPALDPETGSELIVLHDLLAFRGRSDSALLADIRKQSNWAVAEWCYGDLDTVSLPWPAPPCHSFLEFDLFLSSWNEELFQMITDGQLKQDRLAFVWVSAGTSIVDNKAPESLPKPEEAQGPAFSGQPWESLKKRLKDLMQAPDQGKGSFPARGQEWLVSLALLAMPESGLSDRVQQVLKGLWQSSKGFPKKLEWAFKRRRADRLARLVAANMLDLADRLHCPTKAEKYHIPKKLVYNLARRPLDSPSWRG